MYDTTVTILGMTCLVLILLAIGGCAVNSVLKYRREFYVASLFWVWLLLKYRRTKHTQGDVEILYSRAMAEIEKRDTKDQATD